MSTLTVTPTFGTLNDGVQSVDVLMTLADSSGNFLEGREAEIRVSGFGNLITQPAPSDANGQSSGTLASTVGEQKQVRVVTDPGTSRESVLGPVQVEFLRLPANAFYVRVGGDDANNGTSPPQAWATIDFALTQIGAGDTLFVGAGTYSTSTTITTQASAGSPMILRADRDGSFTGDAGRVLIDAAAADFGLSLNGATHVTVRGFSVTGAMPGANPGGAIRIVGATDGVRIVDCELYGNECGIDADGATNLTLESNRITLNSSEGIALAGSTNVAVDHNLIYGNTGAGLHIENPSTNLSVQQNTFYDNQGAQLLESGSGSTGSVQNNIFADGGADGLSLDAASSLAEDHNLSFGHAGADFDVPGGPDATSQVADPLLVDPLGGDGMLGGEQAGDDDFRLGATSPGLDAGTGTAYDAALYQGGPLAAHSSRSNDELDGSGTDDAALNLGVHVPANVDGFASLLMNGARVAYAMPDSSFLNSAALDLESGDWADPIQPLAVNSTIKWIENTVSTTEQPDEVVGVLVDTGTQGILYAFHWNGRRWSEFPESTVTSNFTSANTDQRGFDVEVEALDGDTVFVYADGDDNPSYRVLKNGVWSDDADVFTASVGTGRLLWTDLIRQEGTDRIALLGLTDTPNLVAAIWDGDGWISETFLDNEVNEILGYQAFDAAWEGLSSDLLVSYGYTTGIEETRFATWTSSTETWLTGQLNSTDAVGALTRLAADPLSDKIVAIHGEGTFDDDIVVTVWDGDIWSDTLEVAPDGVFGTRAMDVGWVGDTGVAFAVWRDEALTGTFNFARLDPLGWKVLPEVDLPVLGSIVEMEIVTLPGESVARVALLDDMGGLYGVEFDGTDWTLQNDEMPIATGLDPTLDTRAFSIDYRRQ